MRRGPGTGGAALDFSFFSFPVFFPAGSGGWNSGPFCPQPAVSAAHGRTDARRSIERRPKYPEREDEKGGEVRCIARV